MDNRTLAGIAMILAGFGCSAFANWLRHRPSRLERGTQHIYLAGSLGFAGCVGIGIVLLLSS